MVDAKRVQSRTLTQKEDGTWVWKTGPSSPSRLLNDVQASEVMAFNTAFREKLWPQRKWWLIPLMTLFPIGFVVTTFLGPPDSPAYTRFGFAFILFAVAIIVYGSIVEVRIMRSEDYKRIVQLVKTAPKGERTGWLEWSEIVGYGLKREWAVSLAVLAMLPSLPLLIVLFSGRFHWGMLIALAVFLIVAVDMYYVVRGSWAGYASRLTETNKH